MQGSVLPALGFGTGGLRGDDGVEGVRHALEIGYRHIDTARRHQNEAEVGQRLRRSGRRPDVFLTASSPLRREAINDPVMVGIAAAHDKTVQQVARRWLVQQPGVTPIPRSATPSRRIANVAIFDFELTADDMASIFALSAPPSPEDRG